LDGLERLEYRGYDSAGLTVFRAGGGMTTLRAQGRLVHLREKVAATEIDGCCGIAHTRWATHGVPSEENAHPHRSATGLYTVAHNGIIENYEQLKRELQGKGVVFRSQTDTEVVAQLLEAYDSGDPLETLRRVLPRCKGSFALAILYEKEPETLYAARRQSPLLLATTPGAVYLASDASALLPYARQLIRLENGETVRIHSGRAEVFDEAGQPVEKTPVEVARHVESADKSGYAHFMRKEIDEQPEAVRRTLLSFEETARDTAFQTFLQGVDRILFLGCGSAYYVGLVGQYLLEKHTGIPTNAELASEVRARALKMTKNTLVIAISQSGETADTLSALRYAREQGAKTLGLLNVEGSSMSQLCDYVLYTKAGLEVAVATTKAYSTQLALVYALLRRLRPGTAEILPWETLLSLPDSIAQTIHAVQETAQNWARRRLSVRIGGCAQTQRDFLPPRRGLPCRRTQARHHLAD
jgi:glucosamine--fructose-6-phosphate aminotransferase (isomerizing)